MDLNEEEELAFQKALRGHPSSEDSYLSDLGPLAAARYGQANNLTIDFEQIQPLALIKAVRSSILDSTPIDLDDSHLPPCVFHPIIPAREEIVADYSASEALEQAGKILNTAELGQLRDDVCFTGRSVRQMKLGSPVLRSDPALDFRQFRKDMDTYRTVDISSSRFPLEPCDTEKDESLDFPSKFQRLSLTLAKDLQKEKLHVDKEAVEFIESCLGPGDYEHVRQATANDLVGYHGLHSQRLTPVLSPPLSPLIPHVPDSDTCRVPYSSDPVPNVSSDLRAAEKRVFDLDSEPNFHLSGISTMSPADCYKDSDEIDELIQEGLHDLVEEEFDYLPRSAGPLKLDVPLMPERRNPVPMPPELDKIKECVSKGSLPGLDDDFMEGWDADDIDDLMAAKAQTIMDSIEHEEPQASDATARLPIPKMDFRLPALEWEKHHGDAMGMFHWMRQNIITRWDAPKWPRQSQAQEMKMIWTPMPAKIWKQVVNQPESIEAEPGALEELLEASKNVMTSADLVWKREGLAILRSDEFDDDDEDELVPFLPGDEATAREKDAPEANERHVREQNVIPRWQQHGSRDSQSIFERQISESHFSLGQKRPQEAPGGASMSPTMGKDEPEDLMTVFRRRKEEVDPKWKRQKTAPTTLPTMPSFLSGGSRVSEQNASSMLDNFMALRAPEVLQKQKTQILPMAAPERLHDAVRPRSDEMPNNTVQTPLASARSPTFVPVFKVPQTGIKIIVSQSLGNTLDYLRREIPGVDLVERDYDAHNFATWRTGSIATSLVVAPTSHEADIIMSPSTGLVLTTMLMVRQKPIPGTQAQSFLRERVRAISARYERLCIIVSEGNAYSEATHKMAAADTAVLAEFTGFAEGLETSTSVYYVGGGEATAAKWAAALICRYAVNQVAIAQLVQGRETRGELFLRRAGLNAYAAQIVLGWDYGLIRVPGQGLAAFLMMAKEDRVAHFGELCGHRVLRVVSHALDHRWDD